MRRSRRRRALKPYLDLALCALMALAVLTMPLGAWTWGVVGALVLLMLALDRRARRRRRRDRIIDYYER